MTGKKINQNSGFIYHWQNKLKQGKKVCTNNCFPAMLCDLFWFPRWATKCKLVMRKELQYSFVDCFSLRKAVKINGYFDFLSTVYEDTVTLLSWSVLVFQGWKEMRFFWYSKQILSKCFTPPWTWVRCRAEYRTW